MFVSKISIIAKFTESLCLLRQIKNKITSGGLIVKDYVLEI